MAQLLTLPRVRNPSMQRRSFGGAPARVLLTRRTLGRQGRVALCVQNNELNKWANRDGHDEDSGLEDNGFDKDTAAVVLRVLTARATQRVLMQLQELDVYKAQWMNNFCSENPPSEGNKFITKLFNTPGKTVRDMSTGTDHVIEPQNLAHRVLQVREAMSRSVTDGFLGYVKLENTSVLRKHLESNSYTSGSSEGSSHRRSLYRHRRGRPQP